VRELLDRGFAIVPGPVRSHGLAQLSEAYDRAVASADPADVSRRSSTRVHDFVNRGPEFDCIYVYGPLLSACRQIIRGPFKLSVMLARTLEPGAPAQPLHVDVTYQADGWPLVGFILMVDDFASSNGATRFVAGSHLLHHGPPDSTDDTLRDLPAAEPACGTAGSMIIFNGSVWHAHGANSSSRPRRSIQGAFVPRDSRAAIDQAARIRPETLRRISDLARSVLDVAEATDTAPRS